MRSQTSSQLVWSSPLSPLPSSLFPHFLSKESYWACLTTLPPLQLSHRGLLTRRCRRRRRPPPSAARSHCRQRSESHCETRRTTCPLGCISARSAARSCLFLNASDQALQNDRMCPAAPPPSASLTSVLPVRPSLRLWPAWRARPPPPSPTSARWTWSNNPH